jgi:ParB family chromosome partitioning protein
MTEKKKAKKPAHPQLPKMDTHRGGLGRGLSALIPTAPSGPRLGEGAADVILGPSTRSVTSEKAAAGGALGALGLAKDALVSAAVTTSGSPEVEKAVVDAADAATADAAGTADTGAVNEFGATYREIPVSDIRTNPRNPRQVFEEEALGELVHSIREFGLLQPIVVRPLPQGSDTAFELIMGERRLRATELAGLEVIPAIVRETDDQDMLRDALLENIHRVQLNPLEEASAYQQLMEEFDVSQAELARRIGRSRPLITNMIRLLQLPVPVQRKVAAGVLSAGHARAILGVKAGAEAQEALAGRIVAEGLSVRATEEAVVLLNRGDGAEEKPKKREPREQPEAVREWATSAADALDTRVTVQMGAKKGKIVVEFGDSDDFERITDLLKLPRD